MYQYKNIEDTIVALATAPGVGSVGIIRLSGKEAIAIVDKIFKAKSKQTLSSQLSHRLHYGWIVNRQGQHEEIIDEVLVSIMRAPKSYTTEDIVEINAHGGMVALGQILQQCLEHGARLAQPGEFTKRAFLYGRIDLTQAEAVLDIIHAKTEAFLRVSTHQLQGELNGQLTIIRDQLMSVFTMIEAIINFPEDDIDAQNRIQINDRIKSQAQVIKQLLDSSQNGRLLKEGIRIVLCGKPNVGKSSLLNVLLKQQRAIVTDIAGTTRDVLEESAQIDGIRLQLVDTAGILEPRDLVEEEAVKRSLLYIDSADLVLLVIDTSRPLEDADYVLFNKLKDKPVLVVLNKSDLPTVVDIKAIPFKDYTVISAQEKRAIGSLESAIVRAVTHGQNIDPHALMVSNVRHIESLKKAFVELDQAQDLVKNQAAWEVISENIKTAIINLDAITGRNVDEDLIDTIFSEFCIGK